MKVKTHIMIDRDQRLIIDQSWIKVNKGFCLRLLDELLRELSRNSIEGLSHTFKPDTWYRVKLKIDDLGSFYRLANIKMLHYVED